MRKGRKEALEEGPAPSENRPNPTSLGLGRAVRSKGLSPTDLSPSPERLPSWIAGPPSWTRLRMGRWGAMVLLAGTGPS